jgi:DNA-binding MarR family transcriptional regulator
LIVKIFFFFPFLLFIRFYFFLLALTLFQIAIVWALPELLPVNDTVKAIAEELEIKPATLKKAIRIAHKAKLGETNKDHEELNTILETVGKTL